MYSNLSVPKGGGGGRSLGLLSCLILSAVFYFWGEEFVDLTRQEPSGVVPRENVKIEY